MQGVLAEASLEDAILIMSSRSSGPEMVVLAPLRYICPMLGLDAEIDHRSEIQMRLGSTIIFMPFLPAATIGYGWVCERHVHVAAICVLLFLTGLFLM